MPKLLRQQRSTGINDCTTRKLPQLTECRICLELQVTLFQESLSIVKVVILHLRKSKTLWELETLIVHNHGLFGKNDGIVVRRRRPAFTLANRVCGQESKLVTKLLVAVVNTFKSLRSNAGIQAKVRKIALFCLFNLFGQFFGLGHATFENDINVLVGNGTFFRAKDRVRSKADGGHNFFLADLVFVLQATLLDDYGVELELLLCAFDNLLLDCVLRDKTVDIDGLLLTEVMATILRLQIGLGVPITIIS